jgi:predicted O-methyltransferase YrrM
VLCARERARALGFEQSCEDEVGALLAALAAAAPVDLVFADAQGGKTDGLDRTVAALAPGGVLVVDDMDLSRHADDGLAHAIGAVHDALAEHPDLVVAELHCASGVMVATCRRANA